VEKWVREYKGVSVGERMNRWWDIFVEEID
jgi:hypothetical protein